MLTDRNRNINPRHLVQEDNIINQTRKACALFFGTWISSAGASTGGSLTVIPEAKLIEWEDGRLGLPSWSDGDFVAWAGRANTVCAVIHGTHRCSLCPGHWIALGSLDELEGS